jgi:uncharacterized membrane protein
MKTLIYQEIEKGNSLFLTKVNESNKQIMIHVFFKESIEKKTEDRSKIYFFSHIIMNKISNKELNQKVETRTIINEFEKISRHIRIPNQPKITQTKSYRRHK